MTQLPTRQTVAIADGHEIGPEGFVVMAGPCSVESEDQVLETAQGVAAAGASMLRGGAFKPRTSPDAFQGLGEIGLAHLRNAKAQTGLPVVTEVLDPRQVELVSATADMLQVGSRNMQNTPLLRELGGCDKPVLLKRGASATVDELLGAADYILEAGNSQVVLCERGIRSFDPSTRYLLDLAVVPNLRSRTGLPVVVDPSHGTGRPDLILPMALGALAVGADGLLIEVHPAPELALSDGHQALTIGAFSALMDEIRQWIPASGRYLSLLAQPAAD